MHAVSKVFLLLLLCYLSACQPPSTYRVAGLFELTTFNETTLKSSRADESILSIATAFQLAIFDINQSYKILPNTKLEYKIFDTEGITTGALSALVDAVDAGAKLVNGPTKSSQATITAVAASVYNVLLASPTASVAALSNRALYPYFIRSVPPDTKQAFAMIEFIHYFYNITNEEKWLNISIISTADDYGVDGAKNLITQGSLASPEIKTSAFQQFLVDSDDVSVEVRELQKSRARIFVAFMAATGFRSVLKEAEIDEIISDYYIWICSDGCSTDDVFDDAGPRNGLAYRHLARGYSGVVRQGGEGELYENYLQRWNTLDPEKFPGAGKTPTPASLLAYDTVLASAYTLSILFNQGIFEPNGAQLYQAAITVNFTGLTGPYLLEANGDRVGDFDVVNMYPNLKLEKTFTFNFTNGLIPIAPTFFHDGTTKVPDLDVKEEFDYWSCHEKKAGNDPTGKTIELEQPDEDDINFIKAHYECDQFIDCQNMSDEDSHCTPSLVVAFIVLGIIAGLMVGAAICFIPFIIVFGWIVPRGRIWVSGTLFLLFITLSSIFGFISIYTWFGKPHPVACNFQLWVFGLSCTALVSSLFAKQVRFWREYEFLPIKSVRNSGLFKWLKNHRELEFLFWFVLASIIPLIFIIIWTAFSTPTAEMVNQDGHDHYLCNTGGLTGPPLGIVYFFIIFGYFEFLLVVCLLISFLVRRVPQPFMDKRLVSLAVFNLIFVSAVIVAIFFILRYISPFAAWLIRTLAILYAFASTLLLQMIPKVIGIFIVDKCKQNTGGKGGPTKKEKGGSFEPSMSGSASNTQSMGL